MIVRSRSILLLVALASCLALAGCSRFARFVSALQLTTECMRLERLGRYAEALTACSNAMKMFPGYPFPYVYRGFAYEGLGKDARALDDFTKAVSLDSTFQEAYSARGAVRFRLKDYRGALADAATVERLLPDSARGYADECYMLAHLQRYVEAHRACDRAESAPRDRGIGFSTGIDLATRTADWKRALSDADTLLTVQPDAPETYNVRCWLKIETNDFPGAAADCGKALELSSDEPHIRDTRAGLFFLQKRYPAALADENSMIDRYPYSPYGYGGRCAIETQLHHLAAALTDCTRAISLDDADGEWHVLRGNVYRAQGDSARALADYHMARAFDPSAFEALREEAQLDLDRGRAAAAAKLAAAYVAKNPYDPIGHDVYGRALAALGKHEAASQLTLAESGYRARSDTESERSTHLARLRAQKAAVQNSKEGR
jgi:tetratricopeptide (TPR) repeat protein